MLLLIRSQTPCARVTASLFAMLTNDIIKAPSQAYYFHQDHRLNKKFKKL